MLRDSLCLVLPGLCTSSRTPCPKPGTRLRICWRVGLALTLTTTPRARTGRGEASRAAVPRPPVRDTSADFGANEWLVEEMYEQYQRDPGSVDPAWVTYFQANGHGRSNGTTEHRPRPSTAPASRHRPRPQPRRSPPKKPEQREPAAEPEQPKQEPSRQPSEPGRSDEARARSRSREDRGPAEPAAGHHHARSPKDPKPGGSPRPAKDEPTLHRAPRRPARAPRRTWTPR